MLFILRIVFFHIFTFVFANVDPPLKMWRDGSKSAFIQAPYINTVKNTEFVGLQKQISQLWPTGVVSYYLDNKSYDSIINSSIQTAMRLIQSDSCIKFQEEPLKPTGNKTWIHITNPKKARECVHEPLFMQSGEIMLTLGYDCIKYRDILHSLLHAIGFQDEVSHPHRDKYIRVLWNNILPAYRHLFIKEPIDSVRSSVEYDPLSIMHFHERAYSINGKATIIPLEPGLLIYPSEGLSQLDKMRLQLYFGHECNRRKVNDLLNSCKMTLREQSIKLTNEDKKNILPKDMSENGENVEVEKENDENLEVEEENDDNLEVEKENDENLEVEKQNDEHLKVEKENDENLEVEKENDENLEVGKKNDENLEVGKENDENLEVEKENDDVNGNNSKKENDDEHDDEEDNDDNNDNEDST